MTPREHVEQLLRDLVADEFPPECAAELGRYVAPNDDGTFPPDTHELFGLHPRRFAQVTGLRLRLDYAGRIVAWVRETQ